MSDRNTKVYFEQGGDELVVAAGGKITVETDGTIETPEGVFVAVTFDADYFDVADGVVTLNAETVALLELVAAIPTVDPEVAGQVWNDNGTLVVSAGA
jgi:hypothetical protein